MLRPTVKEVVPEKDSALRLLYDNCKRKLFDVKPYIRGAWYGRLADETYFRSVCVNRYTVEWAEKQDLWPDELYFDGKVD